MSEGIEDVERGTLVPLDSLFGEMKDYIWWTHPTIESFKVRGRYAGVSNKEYRKAMEKRGRKYRTGRKDVSNEQAIQLIKEVFAEVVITGWEGAGSSDGNPMPCNKENLLTFFDNHEDVFFELKEFFEDIENFRHEQLEEDLGNL